MKYFNELTLKNKIFLSCLGFILIVSVLIALFTRGLLIAGLTGELQRRGVGIAQGIADGSRVYILTNNRPELTALAYDAQLGNRKDILRYLVISDNQGDILAHTFTTGFPEGIREIVANRDLEAETITPMQVDRHSVFHVCVPVREGIYTVGSVQAGLDQGHIETLIARLRMVFLSFLSVVTVIFFFLSHRLALHITRPIASLIRYTDQLTRGNFNIMSQADGEKVFREAGTRDDEIAALTNSFLRMTAELKLSTDKLRESQEKYRSLFRSGPNPIFVVHSKRYEILDANPKATEVFGYPYRELVGLNFLDLGSLDAGLFPRHYPSETSQLVSSKIKCRRKDGGTLFVNLHASPGQYRDKDVIIVAATDITELVEKDSQLIQASKMANLEKMSVGIAHEINQPLNAIKMGSEYLTMMQERNKPVPLETLKQVITEISAQVTRASEIVARLKTFSRKADFSREVININACVRAVLKIIGRQITLQNIDLVLGLEEDMAPILAHNNRMEQVIFNLITNARDAVNERVETLGDIDRGIIQVVSFSRPDMAGLIIRDNGIGIRPEQMDNIFDSFYTTKAMGEGMGLGLPIIQGIIRDYNGTISVESSPGNGASFKIQFPVRRNAAIKEGNGNEGTRN